MTIGATVLQNELQHRVQTSFLNTFPEGVAIAYALIPQIPSLSEPLKSGIQGAFAGSLQVVWQVLLGIGGIGFLSSLIMEGLPLHTTLDKDWTLGSGDGQEKLEDTDAFPLAPISDTDV